MLLDRGVRVDHSSPGNETKDAHLPTANRLSLSPERLEAISRRLDPDVAARKIPGATIVIGNREQLIFEYHGGYRDPTTRDSLKPDAIWRIYSMTKPVVTVSAMVFVERGLLRLDQPVAEFIPSFANLRVMHADGSQVPARQAPTIQDLMRHTAGLAYGYLGDSPAQRAYVADGFLAEDLSNAEFVDHLQHSPLSTSPERFGTTAMRQMSWVEFWKLFPSIVCSMSWRTPCLTPSG